jgi:hypothetical protein
MKLIKFIEDYGKLDDVEIFRGEDLPAGLPERPGLYAWYFRPRLRISATTQYADEAAQIAGSLQTDVIDRLQRQPYRVELKADLEPTFAGQVEHHLPRPKVPAGDHRASAILGRELQSFFYNAFAPFFSPPLYVGLAVEQPISARIGQHLSLLDSYREKPDQELQRLRAELLGSTAAPSGEGHSFALEAAVRRIRTERLVLLTYAPQTMDAQSIQVIESVVNRVVFPLCGRR